MVLLRSSGACERVSLGVLAVADLAEQQPALFDLLVDRPVQICIGPRVKNVDSCGHSAAHAMVSSPPQDTIAEALRLAVVVASARGALDPLDLAAAEIALCLPGLAEDASQGWARAHLPAGGRPEARHAGVARGALRRHSWRAILRRAHNPDEARHRRRLRVQGGRPDRAALELGRARRGTLFSRCFRDGGAGAYARVRAKARDGGLRGKRARARVRQRRRGVGVGGRVQRQAGRASRRKKGSRVGRFVRRRKVRSAVFHPAPCRRPADDVGGLHLASGTEASITNPFAVSRRGRGPPVAVDAAGGTWSWGSGAYGQCGHETAAARRVRRGPRLEGLFSGGAAWWRRHHACWMRRGGSGGVSAAPPAWARGRRRVDVRQTTAVWRRPPAVSSLRPEEVRVGGRLGASIRSRVRGAPRRHARRADARARLDRRGGAPAGAGRRRRDRRRRLGVAMAGPARRRLAEAGRLRAAVSAHRSLVLACDGACTGSGKCVARAGRARARRPRGRCGSRCPRAGNAREQRRRRLRRRRCRHVRRTAPEGASFSFSRGRCRRLRGDARLGRTRAAAGRPGPGSGAAAAGRPWAPGTARAVRSGTERRSVFRAGTTGAAGAARAAFRVTRVAFGAAAGRSGDTYRVCDRRTQLRSEMLV